MIITVTLNTSIDKAYYMEGTIQNGEVMRVASCRNTAGGKGLNVARIIKLCDEKVQATGFAGGYNGAYLEALLTEDNIKHHFIHIKGETRSCINILDKGYGSTEYLEPGCEVSEAEEAELLKGFKPIIQDSSIITISGSVPKGLSLEIYQKLICQAKEEGKSVILDTSGKLLENGLKARPTMVKPNQDEIEMLFGTRIRCLDDVIYYARKVYEMGIPYVVISLGGDGALLVCDDGIYHGQPPKIDVVNTVGCGDSMVGAFAVSLERGYEPRRALSFAVAIAAANALSPKTGYFEQNQCETILKKVIVKKL